MKPPKPPRMNTEIGAELPPDPHGFLERAYGGKRTPAGTVGTYKPVETSDSLKVRFPDESDTLPDEPILGKDPL